MAMCKAPPIVELAAALLNWECEGGVAVVAGENKDGKILFFL
jgi:hypothetical protein